MFTYLLQVAYFGSNTEDPSVAGTAMFCQMINDFFDCSNVRSLTEHERKRNDWIKPNESPEDKRFLWLKDTFLKYLEDWLSSVAKRNDHPIY